MISLRLGEEYHSGNLKTYHLSSDVTFANLWNGYNSAIVSPYCYNGTNIYTGGMFVADGIYDPNATDANLGVYVF